MKEARLKDALSLQPPPPLLKLHEWQFRRCLCSDLGNQIKVEHFVLPVCNRLLLYHTRVTLQIRYEVTTRIRGYDTGL